jgi:ribosomal protein L29
MKLKEKQKISENNLEQLQRLLKENQAQLAGEILSLKTGKLPDLKSAWKTRKRIAYIQTLIRKQQPAQA